MKESKLFAILPEDYISTPDGMEIHKESGDLVLACPNFADTSMPGCILRIDKDRNIRKWYDVPVCEETGAAHPQGIAFGPDGSLYICDNQGWGDDPKKKEKGRMLRIIADEEGNITKYVEMATGMEHPNGVKIWGDYIYVTQSLMPRVKDPSGKLVSAVYKFHIDDENIKITNTLEDKNILVTFITQNPNDQYGVDGIEFDKEGNLYVGNFGDGAISKITFNEDGSIKDNFIWAQDLSQMQTTDGFTMDDEGNLYVADFSANAIAKVTPDGKVERLAQSPDSNGLGGELDQPGEPRYMDGKLIISCFDLVVGPTKVNTKHEMPATMAMIEL